MTFYVIKILSFALNKKNGQKYTINRRLLIFDSLKFIDLKKPSGITRSYTPIVLYLSNVYYNILCTMTHEYNH